MIGLYSNSKVEKLFLEREKLVSKNIYEIRLIYRCCKNTEEKVLCNYRMVGTFKGIKLSVDFSSWNFFLLILNVFWNGFRLIAEEISDNCLPVFMEVESWFCFLHNCFRSDGFNNWTRRHSYTLWWLKGLENSNTINFVENIWLMLFC